MYKYVIKQITFYYLSIINMKQSKIIQILNTNEWEWKFGKMYSITLKLENWETIAINKKKPDAFKEWFIIKYEEVEPGKKWKEINDKKQESGNFNPRSYFTSIAYQIAFDKMFKWEDDYDNSVRLAKRIFGDMLDNYVVKN